MKTKDDQFKTTLMLRVASYVQMRETYSRRINEETERAIQSDVYVQSRNIYADAQNAPRTNQ